ncbi:transglycosylase SLT domain-containing protein [Xenorhabdus innexi]|uniref:Putative bacteriophage protein n=1 Tax=Xenorhabdus innexi TaxID=290109 RepID=A0A1N6MZC3_9GAMM|nr:transglycosylase SLT domain-containing protein [Xenorhabdus innexi]PHM30032.1 putative transglycosylase signal peptide protein [Xenorhabdus innexi]SIP74160.1 putative bacteriophage protein [Xenorhabdus innexi]
MATLVDTLLVGLKLDMSGFASDAHKAIQALDDLDKKAGGASTAVVKLSDDVDEAADSTKDFDQSNQDLVKSMDKLNTNLEAILGELSEYGDKTKKNKEKTQDWSKSVNVAVKALAGLFTTLFVSTGLTKLINDVSSASDQLHFLSKNTGLSAETIKKWQNAAEMSGGTADGMAATLSGLNKSLWDLVTVGDASILPFFNALGVGVVDSQGKLRNLDDILLDMAGSMSQMDRPQAYNIAKNMGIDDGTINTLLEGRDAIQKRLDAQKNLVISTKEELELNRKLREQNSVLSQQWEGLKTLVANYLIPRLLKLSTMVTGFLEYLNKNRETAINVFRALSVFLTLTLIPVLFRTGRMLLLAFAPLLGTTGIILALAAALWVLYDDYQTWKKGGDSVLNWKEWDESITWILKKLDEFKEWFKTTTIGQWFTDTNGELDTFKLTLGGLALFLGGPWLAGILTTLSLAGLGLVRFFGLPGLLVGGAVWAFMDFKSKIDNFDWDSLGNNVGNLAVEGIKRTQAAKKVLEAETPKERAEAALFGFGDLLPGGKMAQFAVAAGLPNKIADTISSNTDKKGNVNWSGVAKDALNSAAKTYNRVAAKSKEITSKTQLNSKNANDLTDKAALNAMRGYFMELEKKYKLPAGILYAIAMAESSGRRHLVSEAGAMGPFQFMPKTAAAYGLKGDDVFDWYKSGDAAAEMVSNLSKKFGGKLDETLASYNWGEGRVREKGMENMPKETRKYIPKVKKYMEEERKNRKAQGVVESLSNLQSRMDQPLIPNMDMNAPFEFLAQTDKIRNMPMAGTTRVNIEMNGNVNVYSNSDTVKGTVADGTEAIRTNLSQIISSMG